VSFDSFVIFVVKILGMSKAACCLAVLFLLACAGRASAQVDLSGNWGPLFHEDQPERIPGPEVGDYLGLPITDEARAKAYAWSASLLTLPEHQCKPHPVGYGFRGPSNLRIQQEIDFATQRVRAITIYIQWMQQYRRIWMDGRARPSEYAPHTWQGFSLGGCGATAFRTAIARSSPTRGSATATS
jgi:hypothetical protein